MAGIMRPAAITHKINLEILAILIDIPQSLPLNNYNLKDTSDLSALSPQDDRLMALHALTCFMTHIAAPEIAAGLFGMAVFLAEGHPVAASVRDGPL
jgi:hypothetical protein